MVKVRVEFLSEPSRGAKDCVVSRVPVAGDLIYTDYQSWVVKYSYLAINPKADEVVAIIRVVE